MWRLTFHHWLLRFSLWSSSADDHGHVTFASRHSQCKILRLTSFSPRILYKMLLPAPWWRQLCFRQVTLLAGPRFQFAVPTTGCCMSMWSMHTFQFDQGCDYCLLHISSFRHRPPSPSAQRTCILCLTYLPHIAVVGLLILIYRLLVRQSSRSGAGIRR